MKGKKEREKGKEEREKKRGRVGGPEEELRVSQLTSALNALTASILMKVQSTKDLLCFTEIRDSWDVQCFLDKLHVLAQGALSSWAMPLKMAALFPERHRGAVMRDVTCRYVQSVTSIVSIPIISHQAKYKQINY